MMVGPLYPISMTPVVPGDRFSVDISALIKTLPLRAPVMQGMDVIVEMFFAPTRLYVQELLNNKTNYDPSKVLLPRFTEPNIQGFKRDSAGSPGKLAASVYSYMVQPNSLLSFCGFPIGYVPYTDTDDVSILSRFNAEKALAYIDIVRNYYASSQRSDISMADFTPVRVSEDQPVQYWRQQTMDRGTIDTIFTNIRQGVTRIFSSSDWLQLCTRNSYLFCRTHVPTRLDSWLSKSGYDSLAGSVSVSAEDGNVLMTDIRFGSHELRYKELLMAGNRQYDDFLGAQFDVRVPRDLTIPMYLGSAKGGFSVGEITQTSADPTGTQPLGDLAGSGNGGLRSGRRTFTFNEYGTFVVMFSLRPRNMQFQGIEPELLETTMASKMIPALDRSMFTGLLEAEQNALPPISSINPDGQVLPSYKAPGRTAFDQSAGYQPIYSEYSSRESRLLGNLATTLRYWSFARIYGAQNTLYPEGVIEKMSEEIKTAMGADRWDACSEAVLGTILNNAFLGPSNSPYINPLHYNQCFAASGPQDENIIYQASIDIRARREKSKLNIPNML